MKTTMRLALFTGLLLATAPLSRAQDAPPSAASPAASPKLVRVQMEFVDLSQQQLTELMFGEHLTSNDTELRKQVGHLVAQNKATIVETLICTTNSGAKAKTDSSKEFIFPTEYEPPILSNPGTSGKTDDKAPPAPAAHGDDATGPTPSAWDIRNVGSILEIEPTLAADGRTINLKLLPEIVYHVGEFTWSEWRDKRGTADIKVPIFYTFRYDASLTMISGQPLLACVLSPKGPDGNTDPSRKVMVFVKCEALTVSEK